jgi:hypothetical protein
MSVGQALGPLQNVTVENTFIFRYTTSKLNKKREPRRVPTLPPQGVSVRLGFF